MEKLFSIASKITTPISLAALSTIVLYAVYRVIMESDLLGKLQPSDTVALVGAIIDRIFYVALAALVLGVLSYVVVQTLKERVRAQHAQNLVIDRKPTDKELERFVRELGYESRRPSRYKERQFEAYWAIWKELQGLKEAGNALWAELTDEHLWGFSEQLRKTRRIAEDNAIFFEERHYRELQKVLKVFGEFYLGKMTLQHLTQPEDVDLVIREVAESQIEVNRKTKLRYETLLDNIRTAFRKQLA